MDGQVVDEPGQGGGAFGRIEPQGSGDGVQHAVGDVEVAAALQADVVVVADAGEPRDLLAAQPRDAADARLREQPRLLGSEPGAARAGSGSRGAGRRSSRYFGSRPNSDLDQR
ncbi:hypothetical protein GCM10010358_13060 [Streptomyces minutiscleroticus]|uniref:Uncharacterized protein n=1 Tax=Streptomyces minutiscleroticus TaxID=68238 RepID=A0A918NDU8_9ACTN|nr:hypothetical protein GCM10010358_13060 [Streptomyces minutiscleroticus]